MSTASYRIVDQFPQIDGGTRYLVESPNGIEITIDADRRGQLEGFVRPYPVASDPDADLAGAFKLIRSHLGVPKPAK